MVRHIHQLFHHIGSQHFEVLTAIGAGVTGGDCPLYTFETLREWLASARCARWRCIPPRQRHLGLQRLVRSPDLQGSTPAPAVRCYLTLSQKRCLLRPCNCRRRSAIIVSRFWMVCAWAVRSAVSAAFVDVASHSSRFCAAAWFSDNPKISTSLRASSAACAATKACTLRDNSARLGWVLLMPFITRSKVLWETQNSQTAKNVALSYLARSPCFLWHAPVYALHQYGELCTA